MVDVGKVGRDGAPIRFGKGGKTMRNGRHRPRRYPMQNAKAVAQIALQLLLSPRRRRGVLGCQRRRDPVVNDGAGISVAGLFAAEQVARSVAGAAMAESEREGGAAGPFGALCGI